MAEPLYDARCHVDLVDLFDSFESPVDDLLLFKLLAEREVDDPRLVDLLRSLGDEPPRERVPFYGGLVELARDERAGLEVRRCALSALEGATGLVAIEAFVSALDDADLADLAVAALVRVAELEPVRWAHVVFHGRPEVRRLAVARSHAGDVSRTYDLMLAGDPELGAEVLAEAERRPIEPPGGLVVLLDLLHHRMIPTRLAYRTLVVRPALSAEAHGALLRRRPRDVVDRFLATVVTTVPAWSLLEPADEIDLLLTAIPDDETVGVERACLNAQSLGPEIAAAVWRDIHARGAKPSRLVLLAQFHPSSLVAPSLTVAEVRAAAELYARWGLTGFSPRVPELVRARVLSPAGEVDLLLLARFLRLCKEKPFATAFELCEEAPLARALAVAPMTDVIAFLALHDKDEEGRRRAVELLPLRAEPTLLDVGAPTRTRAEVMARFLVEAPLERLDLVSKAPEAEILAALSSLGDGELAALRVTFVGREMTEHHDAGAIPRLVGALLGTGRADAAVVRALLVVASEKLEVDPFVTALLGLEDGMLCRALAVIEPGALVLGKEIALAAALADHRRAELAAWAKARLPVADDRPPPAPRVRQGVAYRPAPVAPSVEACVALFGSMDPPEATDAAFLTWGSEATDFLEALDREMARVYAYGGEVIATLGHAWLWRWDPHALAHLERGLEEHGDLAALVDARRGLRAPALRRAALAAIASALAVMVHRDRARFIALVDTRSLHALLAVLPTDAGVFAAQALATVRRAREHALDDVVPPLRLLLPELDEAVREALRSVVDAEGLAPRRKPRALAATDDEALARLRASTDLAELVRATHDERPPIVHEATLRLIELGDEGCAALADRVAAAASADEIRPILDSLPLWPADGPRAVLFERAAGLESTLAADVGFRVAMAAVEWGQVGAIEVALRRANAPTDVPFFEAADWDALVARHDDLALARALAASPQPHAYLRAVERLLVAPIDAAVKISLRHFLAAGTARMGSLRRRAAMHLHHAGDDFGFPLVVGQCLDVATGRPHLFDNARAAAVRLTAMTFLAAGVSLAKEQVLLQHLATVPAPVAEEALEAVLAYGASDKARMAAARLLSTREARERKLLQLAEVFAWGQGIAVRTLGKPMRIKMTGTLRLGFTRTRTNAIFVTPMPMLRGDRDGRAVVEGLILHELGHHLHHAGPANEAVWKKAEDQGLHGVFNLVADEHLERNLRAVDGSWGDRLKRLAAYAFQHTSRSVSVRDLLSHLGARAFEVLSQTRLLVDRHKWFVKVESGALLFSLERSGVSFARFARALRMGLGNRHDDPKVEQALALFPPSFKKSSMEELYAITLKLHEIFGFEVRLAGSVGPHEELSEGGVDDVAWGAGITQEEIDRMIERVSKVHTGTPRGTPAGPGMGGRLVINVNEDTKFDKIQEVRPVPFDATAYAPYRRKVDRPAGLLRGYLEEMGLRFVDRRMLVSGRSVDRVRLMPLALRGDPRALRSREVRPLRDLYLGLAIDCSGSMASRDNMERAKLFGALIVEAARPLSEVDVKVFGFTDRVIFDCGPKERCAVHGLSTQGGNNDAAALYHVASDAKRSRRKAKVLVMVSDGLPTECSVAALKNLVQHLSRRESMIVAQVAVQPLSEKCFPYYVVLTDASIETTVRKFGGIVAGLVQKALAQ